MRPKPASSIFANENPAESEHPVLIWTVGRYLLDNVPHLNDPFVLKAKQMDR
jgi:hypothetical protein